MWTALLALTHIPTGSPTTARTGRNPIYTLDGTHTPAQRRRLVASERKRLVETQQMLSVEQAMLFVTALAEAARRHVTDPRVLAAMSDDIERTLSAADPARRS